MKEVFEIIGIALFALIANAAACALAFYLGSVLLP